MKNCFGLTPATIYGTGAGVDEPSVIPNGGRSMVHAGNRQPSKSARRKRIPPRPGRNLPRAAHRGGPDFRAPIHLAIVEGVKTMTGGEGPWIREDLQPAAPA
jgi:hypothetical protein